MYTQYYVYMYYILKYTLCYYYYYVQTIGAAAELWKNTHSLPRPPGHHRQIKIRNRFIDTCARTHMYV